MAASRRRRGMNCSTPAGAWGVFLPEICRSRWTWQLVRAAGATGFSRSTPLVTCSANANTRGLIPTTSSWPFCSERRRTRCGRSFMIDARSLIGTHDILLLTLDTLRYDVAQAALEQGLTPNL